MPGSRAQDEEIGPVEPAVVHGTEQGVRVEAPEDVVDRLRVVVHRGGRDAAVLGGAQPCGRFRRPQERSRRGDHAVQGPARRHRETHGQARRVDGEHRLPVGGVEQQGMHGVGVEELLAVPAGGAEQTVHRMARRVLLPCPDADHRVEGDGLERIEEGEGRLRGRRGRGCPGTRSHLGSVVDSAPTATHR